jgi:hypothetical protein
VENGPKSTISMSSSFRSQSPKTSAKLSKKWAPALALNE